VPSKRIDPASLPTMAFDWGVIKPLVAGESETVSLMHVVLLPGQGHERHNHPDADEILYVLAGRRSTPRAAPRKCSRRSPTTARSRPARRRRWSRHRHRGAESPRKRRMIDESSSRPRPARLPAR
jgi:hypothetical protein